MLFFADQEKSIKVFRLVEDGSQTKRVRLGSVQKSKMEVGDELLQALGGDEVEEVKKVIEMYVGAKAKQMQLDVARFPEVIRHVVDYISSGQATDVEQRMFAATIMNSIRQLRRHDRETFTP